ncbi:MAG: NTF2-like N-terminal transpeptidase domain, partial [Actinomycetota bacterium]|nr:NTF2-like N-terminal transpeptidase domain [Actinomycetota bacterium]
MAFRAFRLCAALAALALFAACTSVTDALDEGPQDVVNQYVAAWNEQDFETMNSLLADTPLKQKWHSGAMRVFFQKVLEDGRFTDFQVTANVTGEPTGD